MSLASSELARPRTAQLLAIHAQLASTARTRVWTFQSLVHSTCTVLRALLIHSSASMVKFVTKLSLSDPRLKRLNAKMVTIASEACSSCAIPAISATLAPSRRRQLMPTQVSFARKATTARRALRRTSSATTPAPSMTHRPRVQYPARLANTIRTRALPRRKNANLARRDRLALQLVSTTQAQAIAELATTARPESLTLDMRRKQAITHLRALPSSSSARLARIKTIQRPLSAINVHQATTATALFTQRAPLR